MMIPIVFIMMPRAGIITTQDTPTTGLVLIVVIFTIGIILWDYKSDLYVLVTYWNIYTALQEELKNMTTWSINGTTQITQITGRSLLGTIISSVPFTDSLSDDDGINELYGPVGVLLITLLISTLVLLYHNPVNICKLLKKMFVNVQDKIY